MRVLHVISGIEPENGGPTAALAGHCRAMVAAGTQASIVATWKSKTAFDQAEALIADGIAVQLLGPTKRPFRRHPKVNETLAAAIAGHDVVHIHAVWEWIEHRAAVIARKLGKPYVWTPHGMLDEWNLQRNSLFKKACLAAYLRRDLNAAAAIHVATDFEARNVAKLNLAAPNFVQGFGLDVALLNAAIPRGHFRQAIGLPLGAPLVLFLGRIQRGKGLETLIPAFAAMKNREAGLVIAGPDEGEYRKCIETLVATHGVTNRVKFVGMIGGQEKLEALGDADVLAAPSSHESFGIAVAEAIAVGTPVVVSDQVGLAGLIADHDLGRVAPLTIAATAAALDEMVDAALQPDADDRTRRHARARDFARAHFAWPTIARHWQVEYERIAAIRNP